MKRLDWDLVRKLWEDGYADNKIAQNLNTHKETIFYIRKKLGLPAKHKRGRPTANLLRQEIEKEKIVINTDYHGKDRLIFYRGSNNHIIKKVTVPRLPMPEGIENIKSKKLYFFKGNEELAFKEYMDTLPEKNKEYFRLINLNLKTRRINYIRNFFGLPKIKEFKI